MKKKVSLSLAVFFIFGLLCAALPTAAAADPTFSEEISAAEEVILPLQMTSADLPETMVYSEALTKGHVRRLYEEEDPDALNSALFLNRDGSATLYVFPYDIKYRDAATGEVRDKSNVLSAVSGNTAYETLQNNIITRVAASAAGGASVSDGQYTVSLTPRLPVRSPLHSVRDPIGVPVGDQAMLYENAFAQNVSLLTAPSVDGLLQQVVMSAFPGMETISFRLDAEGLTPMFWGGALVLTDASGVHRMRISLPEVTDGAGRTALGTLALETDEAGDCILTAAFPSGFLSVGTSSPVTATMAVSPITFTGIIDPLLDYGCEGMSGYSASNVAGLNYESIDGYGCSSNHFLIAFPSLSNNSVYQSLGKNQITRADLTLTNLGPMVQGEQNAERGLYLMYTDWSESEPNWDIFYDSANCVANTPTSIIECPTMSYLARFDLSLVEVFRAWKSESISKKDSPARGVRVSNLNMQDYLRAKYFYSMQAAYASYRPVLSLYFRYASFPEKTITLFQGESVTPALDLAEGVSRGNVSWTSTNSSVVSVSSNGVLTALASSASPVSIRITCNGTVDTLSVRVLASKTPTALSDKNVYRISAAGMYLNVANSKASITTLDQPKDGRQLWYLEQKNGYYTIEICAVRGIITEPIPCS